MKSTNIIFPYEEEQKLTDWLKGHFGWKPKSSYYLAYDPTTTFESMLEVGEYDLPINPSIRKEKFPWQPTTPIELRLKNYEESLSAKEVWQYMAPKMMPASSSACLCFGVLYSMEQLHARIAFIGSTAHVGNPLQESCLVLGNVNGKRTIELWPYNKRFPSNMYFAGQVIEQT